MTTSTTPPLLTPLPPAPLPTDAEALFDAKAGASLTAQAAMVGEVNTALNWQADSMAASLDYRNTAVSSAADAAASAGSASASAAAATADGAAQVALARAQASNAAASANSAQSAAVAAGAAAGLPSIIAADALDVLQVNSAKTGVQWGKAGQSVGDILVTARNPGPTYANTGRAIYPQSTFPDLYALLGAQPDLDRSVQTSFVLNSSFSSDNLDFLKFAMTNSLMIVLVQNSSFCYTSTDGGENWIRRPVPFSNAYTLTCNNGVFACSVSGNSSVIYTTVDGVLWSARSLSASYANLQISSVGGLFVGMLVGQSGYITSSDGVVWISRTYTMGAVFFSRVFLLNNVLFMKVDGNSYGYYTADGVTWVTVIFPAAFGSVVFQGGIYYGVYDGSLNGATLYTASSLIGPWTLTPNLLTNPDGSTGNWVQGAVTGNCIMLMQSSGKAWVSSDAGKTWEYRTLPVAMASAIGLPDRFWLPTGGCRMMVLPIRSYDVNTAFITTRSSAQPNGLTTYIKGKLV